MTTEPTIFKYVHALPVSDEAARYIDGLVVDSIRRWMDATPQERAAWAAEAEQARVRERAAADHVPLTLDALLDKMGWSEEYAEHLVQPYCECEEESYGGGWSYCQHARDLGFAE